MLAWKWWRDCRGRVLLYCGAAAAFGVLAALDATAYNWWMENFKSDPQRNQFYVYLAWNRVFYGLLSPAYYGAAWTGIALALSSIGKDYASPGASFLLTRPQSRTAMVWVDCALAVGAVAMTGALLVGSAMAVAVRELPYIRPEALVTLLPMVIAIAMAIYGLTMFWIVATRNAVKGVELTLATILTASLVPGAALEWWHIAWPETAQRWMLKIFEWQPMYSYWIDHPHPIQRGFVRRLIYTDSWRPVVYHSLEPYPIGVLAVWIGVGLALIYASQKILEHREV
jgi:hypothetical protein